MINPLLFDAPPKYFPDRGMPSRKKSDRTQAQFQADRTVSSLFTAALRNGLGMRPPQAKVLAPTPEKGRIPPAPPSFVSPIKKMELNPVCKSTIQLESTCEICPFQFSSTNVLATIEEGQLFLRNLETGENRSLVYYEDYQNNPINTCAFSPDGSLLAVGFGDGKIDVWSLENGITFHQRKLITSKKATQPISALLLTQRHLFAGTMRGQIFRASLKSANDQWEYLIHDLPDIDPTVFSFAISPNRKNIAALGYHSTVTIFKNISLPNETDELSLVRINLEDRITAVAFDPSNPSILAIATHNQQALISIFDHSKDPNEPILKLPLQGNAIWSLDWSGKKILAIQRGGRNQLITISIDLSKPKEKHVGQIDQFELSRNRSQYDLLGSKALILDEENQLQIWDIGENTSEKINSLSFPSPIFK